MEKLIKEALTIKGIEMKTATEYLTELYQQIRPRLVVEIGSDPRMTLAARTGHLTKEIAVVDFKQEQDYKRSWWNLHREMGGINLTRIDGDALNLSSLISEADIVYSHNVLFDSENGEDTRRMLAYNRREIDLPETELNEIEQRFREAEIKAIDKACKVASNGHIIWFSKDKDIKSVFDKIDNQRKLLQGRVSHGIGEFPDLCLDVFHLTPQNYTVIQ